MKHLALIAILSACADQPTDDVAQASSEQQLEQQVWQYCAMTRDGVTTYQGLTGAYQRMGVSAADEPVRLKLLATRDDPDARGTFSGTVNTSAGIAAYAGRFAAIPDNPAIGAALALDTNSDGEYEKLYFVLAIRRSLGQVRGLCLQGAGHPFLLSRTYF